jgi:hypothetical protein
MSQDDIIGIQEKTEENRSLRIQVAPKPLLFCIPFLIKELIPLCQAPSSMIYLSKSYHQFIGWLPRDTA